MWRWIHDFLFGLFHVFIGKEKTKFAQLIVCFRICEINYFLLISEQFEKQNKERHMNVN